jgi:hypothetical protein
VPPVKGWQNLKLPVIGEGTDVAVDVNVLDVTLPPNVILKFELPAAAVNVGVAL